MKHEGSRAILLVAAVVVGCLGSATGTAVTSMRRLGTAKVSSDFLKASAGRSSARKAEVSTTAAASATTAAAPATTAAPTVAATVTTAAAKTAVTATTTPMRKVMHDKEPGAGYRKGSPLYKKQEATKNYYESQGLFGSLAGNGWSNFTIMNVLLHLFAYAATIAIYACLYVYLWKPWADQRHPIKQERSPTGFTYSWWSCENLDADWPICLCGWCCPMLRWADTVSSRNIHPSGVPLVNNVCFWVAVAIAAGVYWAASLAELFVVKAAAGRAAAGAAPGLAAVLQGLLYLVAVALPVTVAVYFRQRLRQAFNHEGFKAPATIAADFVLWCCCPCCALVQEAREVDRCQKAMPADPQPWP